jgi:GTP-binding protein HflX
VQSHNRVDRPAKEVCIVARVLSSEHPDPPNPLDELTGLAETAGTEVVAGIMQKRVSPDQKTYLGKGKVAELKQLVKLHDADVVVFDNDLSPAQTRNLEKAIETKVIDRTELILDIFANNARTYESRLAVELAQLEYSLPRLKRMWTHLSRQTMGVGMRGPGEKQLEVDRRLAVKRIHELKEELHKIERRKQREVAARRDRMTVSLVGYTNAGKSTLMNALTDANVEAADKLFATLDTRTRRWQLPGWGPVLLSDTVGFIRDLPHNLIASFRATLEEAREADLLLHIADASNPAVLHQISAVYSVLKELGIEEKDTLLVLNKIDVPGAEERCLLIQQRYPNAIRISANTREGFPQFSQLVSQALSREFAHVRLKLPLTDGKTVAWLNQVGEILDKQYHEDHTAIEVRLPKRHLGRLQQIIHDQKFHEIEFVTETPSFQSDVLKHPASEPPTPPPTQNQDGQEEVA